jgi:hypothetical protein
VKIGKYLLIGLFALLVALGGLTPSAYAGHGKHGLQSPREHYRGKKNSGPFGATYISPKKQRHKTSFRSPVTGNMVYGKPKR